ncbi:hypothetical protein EAG08_07965 [Chryseobacterium sp. 3008163]|nr:hypothetical protein EAG08_07965 [Chryseobacterium sp. 3008163]
MLGLFSLNSCRQDILPDQETYNNSGAFQLTSKRISLDEAKHKANLVSKIKQVETNLYTDSKNNLQGKTVNFGNGISIDTDDVIYLEKGPDFHSYTFRIDHENAPANAPVENLVISSRPDGTWKEALVTYYLTPLERQNMLSGGAVDFTGKITHEILQNGTYSSAIMQQDVMNCHMEISTYYTRCGQSDDHHNGELTGTEGPCRSETPSVLVVSLVKKCTMALPADTGLGENGEGGGSGPGGLGSNPPDETTTAPNLPAGPNRNNDPCKQLKNLAEKQPFKDKVTILKNNVNTGTVEKGFVIHDDATTGFSPIIEGNSEGEIDYNAYLSTISEDLLYKSYGSAHNHLLSNPDHVGVFTDKDLNNLLFWGLMETYPQNPNVKFKPENSITFVNTNIGFFALKINDLEKLRLFCIDFASWNIGKLEKFMRDTYKNSDQYNITHNSTHDQQITGFLRFIQDYNIGIEFYEGNKDTFGDWKKLTLKNNSNGTFGFTETPCKL